MFFDCVLIELDLSYTPSRQRTSSSDATILVFSYVLFYWRDGFTDCIYKCIQKLFSDVEWEEILATHAIVICQQWSVLTWRRSTEVWFRRFNKRRTRVVQLRECTIMSGTGHSGGSG